MDELCHYGIKGQKWGVRRFQNSDGSYTSEGKRRAQQQEKKDPVKEMKDEDLRKAITRLSLENKYKDLTKKPTPPSKLEPTKKAVDATSELVNLAKKMDQDSRKAAKKERMDLSKKTDKELRDPRSTVSFWNGSTTICLPRSRCPKAAAIFPMCLTTQERFWLSAVRL